MRLAWHGLWEMKAQMAWENHPATWSLPAAWRHRRQGGPEVPLSVPKSRNSVPRVPTGNGLVVLVGPCDEVRERHEEPGQGDQDGATADEARPVHPAPEVADEDDQQRVPNLQWDTKPEMLRIFLV